jgi:hypothetical protein
MLVLLPHYTGVHSSNVLQKCVTVLEHTFLQNFSVHGSAGNDYKLKLSYSLVLYFCTQFC